MIYIPWKLPYFSDQKRYTFLHRKVDLKLECVLCSKKYGKQICYYRQQTFLILNKYVYRDTDPGFGNLRDELVIEPEMIEKYLALMCQFNVDKVVSFLTSSDAYRLDNALEVSRNIISFFIKGGVQFSCSSN